MTAHPPLKNRSTGQLLRFLVVGVSNVLVDLVGYQVLLSLGTPPAPAKGASYALGMVWGYFGNKFWTFKSTSTSVREPLWYILVYAVGLIANVAVNALVLSILGDNYRLFAFLAATGVSTVMNFCGMKFLAFSDRVVSSSA